MSLKAAFQSVALVAVALVAIAPAYAQSRAAAQPVRPWLLLVSHRIDLTHAASRMVSPSRDVRLLAGSRYVINLTTGVLVDREGHVVTRLVNLDPTEHEHDVKVTTSTGAVFDATFVGLDQPSGLAVLSVPQLRGAEPAPTEPAATALATNESVRVVTAQVDLPQIKIPAVERVAVYPKLVSSAGSVEAGASPALARAGVVATVKSDALSSSADVSLVERASGSLVGLVLYVAPQRGNVISMAFARDTIAGRVIKVPGNVQAGWLGAQGRTVAEVPKPQRPAWAPDDAGVLIQTIAANGPADTAGLQRNDVVVGFDGIAVRTTTDLLACVGTTPVGTKIELDVLRDGHRVRLLPVLGGRPLAPFSEPVPQPTSEQTLRYQILGLKQQLAVERDPVKRDVINREIRNLQDRAKKLGSPSLADTVTIGITGHALATAAAKPLGIAGGVAIDEVKPGSPAETGGLRANDLVVSADGTPVTAVDKLDAAVRRAHASGRGTLELEVRRGDETVTVTIALPPPPATPK